MKKSIVPGTSFPGVVTSGYMAGYLKFGIIHILFNHFPEVKIGHLRPEVAKIGCCRRQQHI